MRIVIDLQGVQTESRFRGVGRYSLSLVKAIVKNVGKHEIWLALNGAFKESIAVIRDEFQGLISPQHIRVFQVPFPIAEYDSANSNRTRVAEIIRECFLDQLNPDVVLLTSLFEGYVDEAVTSIGKFSKNYKTAVILYDLIPYIHQKQYLQSSTQINYYQHKIDSLRQADLLLAISKASKDECKSALDIADEKIVNISAAVDESFSLRKFSNSQKKTLFAKYGIDREILLYAPGGFDIRKNFNNLIVAYSQLPQYLKNLYQLVIVSKIQEDDRQNLINMAKKVGLRTNELIITGHVSDEELITFYATCKLFVFPSLHEGFGLPVLEAMACGAPVIGSNTTSIPEVIGFSKALFDPNSPLDMTKKIQEVLLDELLLQELQVHSMKQCKKFSWDESAKKAIKAIVKLQKMPDLNMENISKKRLAYFSPLPPQRSGISDYSKELLPHLSRYYDITLIASNEICEATFDTVTFTKKDLAWFEKNAHTFERILFHMGNSPFHTYMLEMLRKHSGVVVLHDFFLSGLYAYEEMILQKDNFWGNALFYSHGYTALQQRWKLDCQELTKKTYPANLEIIQNSRGLIFHSDYSKELIQKWYGKEKKNILYQIPFLKHTPSRYNKDILRKEMNYEVDDFLVCSFGYLDTTKLSHKLLEAWQQSKLSSLKHCKLIFVGENNGSEYGEFMLKAVAKSVNTVITGWADTKTYNDYLKIASIAVQLRTMSRGETSAAVHDCMAHGLPTIVNANGSFQCLPENAVYMLHDEFEIETLVLALEKLYDDREYKEKLSENAIKTIKTNHAPDQCAKMYYTAIEASYQKSSLSDLIKKIVSAEEFSTLKNDENELLQLSVALSRSIEPNYKQKQILVDVSAVCKTDLKTGIERVVRAQLLQLMKNQPLGYRVEPIYLSCEDGVWTYRYARKYTLALLEIQHTQMEDDVVEYGNSDVYYGADFYRDGIISAINQGLFSEMKTLGVELNFAIYDILPISHPDFFPEGTQKLHQEWLEAISSVSTNLICISKSVADEVKELLKNDNLKVSYNHLGADIQSSIPSDGLPSNVHEIMNTLQPKTTFLMVGTIEPRKGYYQVLLAFEKLWSEGYDINLVIVGKEGWKSLPNNQKRTIPQIISKMHEMKVHNRFFWLEGISDEYLEKVYSVSDCLIAASEAEGFGLPIIEAAQYQKPIIARDIPVFREVAGNYAYFFQNSNDPNILQNTIKKWLELFANDQHVKSNAMTWLTWKESTEQLLTKFLGK